MKKNLIIYIVILILIFSSLVIAQQEQPPSVSFSFKEGNVVEEERNNIEYVLSKPEEFNILNVGEGLRLKLHENLPKDSSLTVIQEKGGSVAIYSVGNQVLKIPLGKDQIGILNRGKKTNEIELTIVSKNVDSSLDGLKKMNPSLNIEKLKEMGPTGCPTIKFLVLLF